ncbi:MAG: hypothetical protein GSR78_00660 [Desulfurococcales archaeon]|nr:hypothetical protein [Desulfurococcales archaeon]
MLQRKPLNKWTSRDLEEWRERLSRLLVLVGKAGGTEKAWSIFYQYRDGEVTYSEARKRLQELAGKTRA